MDNTQTMLKAIITGQSAMKEELLSEIKKVDKKLDKRIDNLEAKVDGGFEKVNERIDKLGAQLAYLEDDAPTREEFDELSEEVSQIKIKIASI